MKHLAPLDKLPLGGKQISAGKPSLLDLSSYDEEDFEENANKENEPAYDHPILSFSSPVPEQMGLENRGLTCYMNAVSQALLSLEGFPRQVTDVVSRGSGHIKDSQEHVLVTAFGRMFQGKLDENRPLMNFGNRSLLDAMMAAFPTSFDLFKMQDASEACMLILDKVNEGLKLFCEHATPKLLASVGNISFNSLRRQGVIVTRKRVLDDDSENLANKRFKSDANLVEDSLMIKIQNVNTCNSCGRTRKEAPVSHFTLMAHPPSGRRSAATALAALLGATQRPEVPCGVGRCQARGVETVAVFSKLPKYIILQLPRQKDSQITDSEDQPIGVEVSKDHSPYYLNKTLDLSDYTNPSTVASPSTVAPKPRSILSRLHQNQDLTITTFDETPDVMQIYGADSSTPSKSDTTKQTDQTQLTEEQLSQLSEAEQIEYATRLSLLTPDQIDGEEAEQEVAVEEEGEDAVSSDSRWLYDLKTVVRHQGATLGVGHYVTEVRGHHAWTRYDDAEVTEAKEREALGLQAQKEAYLLFYQHRP